MKKLYEKSELAFSIVWIVIYCAIMSVGDNLSSGLGVKNIVSLPVALTLSVTLFVFVKRNGLSKNYGLCKSEIRARKMLYYIPLAVMLLVNVVFGVRFNMSAVETVLYIFTMVCVGFLEELIFRGLLFKAMAKDGLKWAVVVSSVTFGVGHIINLFNGSGAELLPNLMQIVYAIAAGFMFVMIFLKSGSLIPCIAGHGVFNALSAFADETALTDGKRIFSCMLLVIVCGIYGGYLAVKIRKEDVA